MFAALIAIMLLSFFLNRVVRLAEIFFMPWKTAEAERGVSI